MSQQPAQKRARVDEPAEAMEMSSAVVLPEISEVEEVFATLSNQIMEATSSSNGESNEKEKAIDMNSLAPVLFKLKRWQRQLMLMQESMKEQLENEIKSLQKEERSLAALQYERAYVEREIAGSSQKTPSLEKLARSEMRDHDTLTTEEVILAFLGSHVSNLSDKQKIITRLHQEINSRGGLERDLKLKQEELDVAQSQLKEKSSFLDNLPKQLETLERASNPLQKFMLSHLSTRSIRMTGSDRRSRMEQARELPAPLYALYHQLQHYLDQRGDDEVDDYKLPSISLTGMTLADSQQQVTLQLPVPDVSSAGRKKRVTINFQFVGKANLVVAYASGCSTALNQDSLLDELFPGDTPEPIEGGNSTTTIAGRPYHWCNYLAGLYVPTTTTGNNKSYITTYSSVRTILRTLQRRIVSNATLKHLLLSLQKTTVPTPPLIGSSSSGGGTNKESTNCRLASFTSNPANKNEYTVKIADRQNQLSVKVVIDTTTYPRKPPVWFLNESGQDSLYESRLRDLEHKVNVELLERFMASDGGGGDDKNYEWILVHQLNEIMAAWNDLFAES